MHVCFTGMYVSLSKGDCIYLFVYMYISVNSWSGTFYKQRCIQQKGVAWECTLYKVLLL